MYNVVHVIAQHLYMLFYNLYEIKDARICALKKNIYKLYIIDSQITFKFW